MDIGLEELNITPSDSSIGVCAMEDNSADELIQKIYIFFSSVVEVSFHHETKSN
jgi:hypothetical protein